MRVIQTILLAIIAVAVLSIATIQVGEWFMISCGDIVSVRLR